MKSSRVCSLVLTGLLVFFGVAHATVLTPGTGGQLPDIFPGCSGCTLLASRDTGVVTTTSNGVTLSFDLVAAVYADPSNTFGAGNLDFMYQVTNEGRSNDSIGRVTTTNFTGYLTDVGFATSGSSLPGGIFVNGIVAPGLVDRNTASTVGFGFAVPPLFALIGPGQASTVLIIQTNATSFQLGNANVIDGQAISTDAFGPAGGTPPVPEPSSIILMGCGLAGMVRVIRKKLD